MPNEYARSGFHSGETASGYFDESFALTIGGTDRTKKCDFDSLEILQSIDGPSEMAVTVHGFTPAAGQEVILIDGGVSVGVPIFGGQILSVTQVSARSRERPSFQLQVGDYTWLLDRYALIVKRYSNLGVNSILGDILTTYTNGSFTVGYCPMSLGNIDDMVFTYETVSDACQRLAQAVGGVVTVDAQKRVSIYVTPDDEGNTLSLTNSGVDFWDFQHVGDISQIRTRVIYEGGGGLTTELIGVSNTTIAVDELGWYLAAGGSVRAGMNLITYTGRSAGSGPGTLTGCSGITQDIAEGASVNVYAMAEDSTAQTTLATLLGGGKSGIATGYFSDGRLGSTECTSRATQYLNYYKSLLQTVSYTTTNQTTRAGRQVTVSLTTPTTLSATLRVQQVRIRGRRQISTGTLPSGIQFDRIVTASPVLRDFSALLNQADIVPDIYRVA